jgi:tetratricopeptide (TPR) repeat protein
MISGAAIFMLRKMFGENSPEVLKSLRNVASTFESRGKLREAETTYREVLAGCRKREEGESQQGLYALESVARVLIAQKKSGEAEQLLDEALSPALIQQSSSVKLLTMRMKLKARRSQWQQAADDAARAFEHRSTDYGRYPILAALLIKTQNLPAYETLRTKLLKGWSDTNTFYVADQVAKACLFLPYSGTESNLVNRLADLPVTKGTKDEGAMPYFRMLKALSEYRQAHYSQAAEWCQTILDRPPTGVHAHACAVFAMSWWKLGKKEEARAILEEGESLAPRQMPASVAEDRDDAWLKWLYARIQLDEATALINAGSAAPTNSGAR